MSLEIRAAVICDGCGVRIESDIEHRSTRAAEPSWQVKAEAEKRGWVIVSRGRYHTQTHWCKVCSDKPMTPVPRKKSTKKHGG